MAHILIIDDEALVRTTLRQALEMAGHRVSEAADGRRGLQSVRESPPDLVVTDIIMPEKEGVETILELRRDHPAVKIIAISGGGRVGNLDFLEMARSIGADRILPKPFDPDDFVAMVGEVLGAPAAAAEA